MSLSKLTGFLTLKFKIIDTAKIKDITQGISEFRIIIIPFKVQAKLI